MTPEDAVTILRDREASSKARQDALLFLVEQFEPEYLDVLGAILSDTSDDPEVRCSIALVLGKVSGEIAFDRLKDFAADANNSVRNYVIRALGMTYHEAALPLIIEALKDKDNTVFATASEALGEMGDMATPYLIELLSSGATDARCVAAWQLGELQASEAVHPLVETIRNEKDVSVIALCIWALGEIGFGSEEVMAILTEAKREAEPDVRLRAEMAMKKIVRHIN